MQPESIQLRINIEINKWTDRSRLNTSLENTSCLYQYLLIIDVRARSDLPELAIDALKESYVAPLILVAEEISNTSTCRYSDVELDIPCPFPESLGRKKNWVSDTKCNSDCAATRTFPVASLKVGSGTTYSASYTSVWALFEFLIEYFSNRVWLRVLALDPPS